MRLVGVARRKANHMFTTLPLLRELYECERSRPERSYARDHSFESWLHMRADLEAGRCVGGSGEEPNSVVVGEHGK